MSVDSLRELALYKQHCTAGDRQGVDEYADAGEFATDGSGGTEDKDPDCAGANGEAREPAGGSASRQTAPAPEQTAADDRAARCWRAVGHEAVWHRFGDARGELDDPLWRIEEALRDDRPVDETALQEARSAADTLRRVLEDYVAPITEGAKSWDGGPPSEVPYGVMADQLDDSGIYRVERTTDE